MNDQLSFPARSSDPATSKISALIPRENQRMRVLRSYAHGPLTDEEAGEWSGVRGAWKRCSELRQLGLIVTSGTTRDSSTGSAMQVCRITGAGMIEVEGLNRG